MLTLLTSVASCSSSHGRSALLLSGLSTVPLCQALYGGLWAGKEGREVGSLTRLAPCHQVLRATCWDLGLAVLTLNDSHTDKWLPFCQLLVRCEATRDRHKERDDGFGVWQALVSSPDSSLLAPDSGKLLS